MKGRKVFVLFLLILVVTTGTSKIFGQDIPDKPNPPRLVNDFAGFLTNQEVDFLERKLVAFDDSTSTQIAIVIVKDLAGYDSAVYAQRLGDKWGI
jgi:uncharacterized protein